MSPAEILLKAADVIETRGWHQGALVDPCGTGVCALGAISIAVDEIPDAQDTWASDHPGTVAVALLGEWIYDRYGYGITYWNDRDGQTKDEVVAGMREAAKADGEVSEP